MSRAWKVAVTAAALACSGSASATFFTYTIDIAGSGVLESGSAGTPAFRRDNVQSAQLLLRFNADSTTDPISASNTFTTDFRLTPTTTGFDIKITPVDGQFFQQLQARAAHALPVVGFRLRAYLLTRLAAHS
ncbi:hypothetical protein ACT009_09965 [Sphingomonas sp. Tas61C01]|uniref:hypothetical protein n=1 Tax=Sphingomonas sp. Tas61C01 TaxID=3458297 RepID=UPI00403E74E0